MKFRHIITIILSLICLYSMYDIYGIPVWPAVIGAYTVTYFPIAAILFYYSIESRNKDTGWGKKIDYLGMGSAVISVAFAVIYFTVELIKYYYLS